MADNLTKAQRRKNMQRIRSKGTLPEKLLARELRKRKVYFSQHSSSLSGKPDFIFRKKNLLVFIDSCFWHKCPQHYIKPKSNLGYWLPKIKRNVRRDKTVNRELKKLGWRVLRIWEHELKKNQERCVNRILKKLQ